MLARVFRPQVMGSSCDATAHHAEAIQRFVGDFLRVSPHPATVLDVGTGTALIPIELCHQLPSVQVVAVDHARNLLELALENLGRSGLTSQVRLQRADAKRLPFPSRTFCSVMSNGLMHHVPDPRAVLREMLRVLAPEGKLFVRDLMRPEDDSQVAHLVEVYLNTATSHQRELFEASLRAALTLDEARDLVVGLGLYADTVQATSDRHWTLSACLA